MNNSSSLLFLFHLWFFPSLLSPLFSLLFFFYPFLFLLFSFLFSLFSFPSFPFFLFFSVTHAPFTVACLPRLVGGDAAAVLAEEVAAMPMDYKNSDLLSLSQSNDLAKVWW